MSDQQKNSKNAAAKPEKKKKIKYPKATIRWTPNPPVIHEDQIISSVAREKNIWGFMPTYEYDECQMNLLLSGEYGRQWFKERDAFDKETYTKEKIIRVANNNFNRKFVQRIMSYKRPTKHSFLESRFRDWSKLTKDEIIMIKLRETKYKVSKDCLKPNKLQTQQKDVKCICSNK